ncbi:hypothetical protein L3Q82_001749 [Scortum barcoo]|uniref:Uncharacterized protein n=1 Tax=Scortum barcoo TaxID=214431 RepID=A0ACB8W3W5_9TELE|nr:hypothetical protein L3Q82_001749 [Scortum barcoo]
MSNTLRSVGLQSTFSSASLASACLSLCFHLSVPGSELFDEITVCLDVVTPATLSPGQITQQLKDGTPEICQMTLVKLTSCHYLYCYTTTTTLEHHASPPLRATRVQPVPFSRLRWTWWDDAATEESQVTGQTKSGSEAHHEKKNIKDRSRRRIGVTGPHPGARPGVGAAGEAPGGRVFAHGTRPGSARNGDVGPPSSRLTTRKVHEGVHEGPVQCGLGSSVVAGEPRRPNPWNKTLAIGTWNVTSLGGKEPELVREVEVERYRLES